MPMIQPPSLFPTNLSPSFRQEISWLVQGWVERLTGGAVSGVKIHLTDKETKAIVRTLTTDMQGRFQANLMQKSTGYHVDAIYEKIMPWTGYDVSGSVSLHFIVGQF